MFFQVWWYDCGCKWPINCRYEPFCIGSYVEGAEEQSHSHSYLLARKPRVKFLKLKIGLCFPFFDVLERKPHNLIVFLVVRNYWHNWYTYAGPKATQIVLLFLFQWFLSSWPHFFRLVSFQLESPTNSWVYTLRV